MLQEHLLSAGRVFLATFVVAFAGVITNAGALSWTAEFWTPLAVAAVSAALKAGIQAYLSPDPSPLQQ